MTLSFLISTIVIIFLGLFLVLFFIAGFPVVEFFFAIFRLILETFIGFFRFVSKPLLKLGWYTFVGFILMIGLASWFTYAYLVKPGNLDSVLYRLPMCTELLDRNHQLIDYICPYNGVRIWKTLQEFDSNLQSLVVMLEDDRFFEHAGLDIDQILNSIEVDLEKKRFARGGSTITQQLAKNLFLTKEKSIIRKLLEVPLAFRLEREFDKDKILELYLNAIEWGPGVYGAEAASRLYFDHPANRLTTEEAWLLALMIPNPIQLNVWIKPEAEKLLFYRAKQLSVRLYKEHRLNIEEAKQAFQRFQAFLPIFKNKRPQIKQNQERKYPIRWDLNRHFNLSEIVSIKRHASGHFGSLTQFRKIVSTLDLSLQKQLEQILEPQVHARGLSDIVALIDGSEIRALVPILDRRTIPKEILDFAKSNALKPHVYEARKIPSSALWP